jgi:hypothetical protein
MNTRKVTAEGLIPTMSGFPVDRSHRWPGRRRAGEGDAAHHDEDDGGRGRQS